MTQDTQQYKDHIILFLHSGGLKPYHITAEELKAHSIEMGEPDKDENDALNDYIECTIDDVTGIGWTEIDPNNTDDVQSLLNNIADLKCMLVTVRK